MTQEQLHMQMLAGIITESEYKARLNENLSPELTQEEKIYLEDKIEKFLNTSVFNSNILGDDSEDFDPTKEERVIQFIINSLSERISYY